MSEILRLKERYEKYLLGIPGVVGVGLNGAVVIYVERLTPELRNILPKNIEGFQVRVKEVGKVRVLRTGRYRPAPGGVSCGHPEITAGTLSCKAYSSTGEIVGLSNNHVIALNWGSKRVGKVGDPTLQPGPYDGGTLDDAIGELYKWVDVELPPAENLVDAAIFRSDMLRDDVLEVGLPLGSIEPKEGMKVLKSGRTTGITYGAITDVHATIQVSGWGTCTFKEQIIVEPAFLAGGDSGSWVGLVDTFETIGLGFAGSSEISVVCRGTEVERLLGIKIIPPFSKTKSSVYQSLLMFAPTIGAGLLAFSPKR
jgi:hypothetical protein